MATDKSKQKVMSIPYYKEEIFPLYRMEDLQWALGKITKKDNPEVYDKIMALEADFKNGKNTHAILNVKSPDTLLATISKCLAGVIADVDIEFKDLNNKTA